MAETTLIFIPDISGFTKFVTNTEIDHSNHIISELIEVILGSNILNLEVSEIEGDAVLFYKKGKLPSLSEIFSQTRKMFIEFHKYLREIERNNVCQCGACKNASGLSLKFIAHLGEIKETTIARFTKLIGSDVILAHRLLKNHIPYKEYLLLTDKFQFQPSENIFSDNNFIIEEGRESFDNFGEINIRYIHLHKLLNEIPVAETPNYMERDTDFKFLTNVKAPLLFVHNMLTDHKQKLKWIPGLKKVEESSPINRINSSHTCIFDNQEVHFITKRNEVKDNSAIYGEKASLKSGMTFVSDFKLVSGNEVTEVYLRTLNGKPVEELNMIKKLIWEVKTFLIMMILNQANKKNIKLFKKFVEREYDAIKP